MADSGEREVLPGNSAYVLPNHNFEGQRLDSQHKLTIHVCCDGRLIFDDSIALPDGSRVLDVATGTGIWAVELANERKNILIDAVDISTKLFPKRYPENVNFSFASILQMPDEWTDRYDFVHQRLLLCALRTTEWISAASEILRVLKPGGSAQFMEYDLVNWPQYTPESRNATEAYVAMAKERELLLDILTELPEIIRKAGFTDIKVEKRDWPVGKGAGEYGKLGTFTASNAWRGFKPAVLQSGGLAIVHSADGYDNTIDGMVREWDTEEKGRQFFSVFVCAKKPEL